MKKLIFGSIILTLSLFALVNIAGAKVERVPGWNASGGYTMDLLYSGSPFVYTLTLNQSGNAITGNLYDPYLPGNLSVDGTITGNAVVFSVNYPTNYQGVRTFTGTINASGVLSGTWSETGTENGSDVWSTTGGVATASYMNHGQYVSSQENKQEAAQSRIGMPVQSEGHGE